MNDTTVALIGPRGAGKTTVGRAVAQRMAIAFVDADDELARAVGMGASEFLRTRGEAEFRRVEDQVSSALLGRKGLVVALGGGGVLCPSVQRALAAPHVFCAFLTAPIAELAARTEGSDRPRLSNLPRVDEIAAVLASRLSLYRSLAALELDTSLWTVDACAMAVIDAAKRRP